jgi:hypothetical protein
MARSVKVEVQSNLPMGKAVFPYKPRTVFACDKPYTPSPSKYFNVMRLSDIIRDQIKDIVEPRDELTVGLKRITELTMSQTTLFMSSAQLIAP